MGPPDETAGARRERSDQVGMARAAALVPDSLVALAAERYTRAPIVYLTVIAVVALACASMPLIHVPVGVRAAGMLRPAVEKQEIRAPVSGRVAGSVMSEGRAVTAGESLIRLSTGDLSVTREGLRELRREAAAAVADLEILLDYVHGVSLPDRTPRSGLYAAEHGAHVAMLTEQSARVDGLRREHDRAVLLMERRVLPPAEVERLSRALEAQVASMQRLGADDRARWSRELAERRRRLGELDRELAALRLEEGLAVLASPGAGTLEGVVPLAVGSFVAAGERLATLTPVSGLRADVHVDAGGVSLIRPGAVVRLRVGGYDPATWGVLTGRVRSISNDAVAVAGQPVFRLDVALDRDHLALADGRVGHLRNGLPVEARIVVARPSVYRLLRGRVTDWVRPGGPAG